MAANGAETETAGVREQELLAKVEALEKDRVTFIEMVREKMRNLEKQLEVRNSFPQPTKAIANFLSDFQLKTEENVRLAERNKELEKNFKDLSSLNAPGKGKNQSKSEDDDLLTRAKELLFEKTKLCKNQEQQLAALNSQLAATKDVLEITKDMLNLRNIENDHLQSRLDSMGERVKAEKDRYLLTEQKLQLSKQKETDLGREYETQRGIFKELRGAYEAKIQLLGKQLDAVKSPK